MKKQLIIFVLLVALTGGLLTALIVIRKQPVPEGAATAQPATENVEIFRFDAPVTEVRFDPAGAGTPFTLKRLPDDGSGDSPGAVLAGREDLPINAGRAGNMLAAELSLEAARLVYQDHDDYALFGLTDPQAAVTMTDAGGLSKTLLIGDLAPDGGNHYVRIMDEPAVYLVPVFRLYYYLLPETGYVSPEVVAETVQDLLQARQIRLGGSVREGFGDVRITPILGTEAGVGDIHSHMLRSPVAHPMDYRYGIEALASIYSMSAYSVTVICPDAGQLAEYGLDKPYSTVEVTGPGSGDRMSLVVGEPDEYGLVYLMREGVPLIYRGAADEMPWLTMQFFDFMDKDVYSLDFADIDEIVVRVEGETYAFTLDHTDPFRLDAYVDGVLMNRNRFANLCDTLRNASYEEYTQDQPPEGAAPHLQVTYRFLSGAEDKSIAFYPGASRKYFIETGAFDRHFYTTSFYVDKLKDDAVAAARPAE